MINDKKAIEEKILFLANEILKSWEFKLRKISVTVDTLSVYRNDDEENYYSEIEFNFWKPNSLETVFSIIIFMNGQLQIDFNTLEEHINEEMRISYKECLV